MPSARSRSINFSMRKSVLEYDDVMNKQRQVIYAERNKILDGKDLAEHVDEVIDDTVRRCVAEFCPGDARRTEARDLEGLHKWLVELTGRLAAPAFDEQALRRRCATRCSRTSAESTTRRPSAWARSSCATSTPRSCSASSIPAG